MFKKIKRFDVQFSNLQILSTRISSPREDFLFSSSDRNPALLESLKCRNKSINLQKKKDGHMQNTKI